MIKHWSVAELFLIAMHGGAGALPALRHSHAVREGLVRLPRQLQLLGKREPPWEQCALLKLLAHPSFSASSSMQFLACPGYRRVPVRGWHQGLGLRLLTLTVCCLQLLSSIYANKVTAYLNGHDHSMTVGNPQQANVSQAYASSWQSQDNSMPSHLNI